MNFVTILLLLGVLAYVDAGAIPQRRGSTSLDFKWMVLCLKCRKNKTIAKKEKLNAIISNNSKFCNLNKSRIIKYVQILHYLWAWFSRNFDNVLRISSQLVFFFRSLEQWRYKEKCWTKKSERAIKVRKRYGSGNYYWQQNTKKNVHEKAKDRSIAGHWNSSKWLTVLFLYKLNCIWLFFVKTSKFNKSMIAI